MNSALILRPFWPSSNGANTNTYELPRINMCMKPIEGILLEESGISPVGDHG